MMSRVTIDLKKHARDHVHYDLSRHVVVADEEGPYCYQMSHIRFRDMITGGKPVHRPTRTPQGSASNQKSGKPVVAANVTPPVASQEAAVAEARDLMGDPGNN